MNSNNMNLSPFPMSQLNNNLQSVQVILSQTNALLRTLVLACLVLNPFLFLSTLLTLGVRYVGTITFLTSLASCGHTAALTMVLSPHIITSNNGGAMNNTMQQFDSILQYTSHQYGNNPLAYGTIMGSTAMLVPLLQLISSYYGGIATCVANHGTPYMHKVLENLHTLHSNTTNGHAYYFDSYGVCGSSGPVHFVSFISSLLSWIYFGIGFLLYTRRGELLDGQGGGGSGGIGGGYQYDEIGESASGGFAGDFPNGGGAIGTARTMQV